MPQMCQSRPEKRNVDELGTDVCTFSQKRVSNKSSIVRVMFGLLKRAELRQMMLRRDPL